MLRNKRFLGVLCGVVVLLAALLMSASADQSWGEWLPDPQAIPGFPDEEREEVSCLAGLCSSNCSSNNCSYNLAAWLEGLGFPITGWAGIFSEEVVWGESGFYNYIGLVAFSVTNAAKRATSILFDTLYPPAVHPARTLLDTGETIESEVLEGDTLGEGEISIRGVQVAYTIGYDVSKYPDPFISPSMEYTSAWLHGRIVFSVENLVYRIILGWASEPVGSFAESFTYENGWILQLQFSPPEGWKVVKRVISAEDFANRLQQLAEFIITVALNKLNQ